MEKYNMILNELKGMKEFKKAIDIDYDSFIDSILITFYNRLNVKNIKVKIIKNANSNIISVFYTKQR